MNLRARKCRACGARVWNGDSDEVCAVEVAVDGNSLSPVGEALARLAGRRTYAMTRHGQGRRLRTRDHWQIGGGRALRWADVVAEHRCGEPLPGIPSKLVEPPTRGTADVCPF